jgi:hypothetical protein
VDSHPVGQESTVPFLRIRNREGCDVYIQPYADNRNAGYILVDLDQTDGARGILRGPGRTNVDTSVFKEFPLTEKYRLHLLACVLWKILHSGIRYIEQGNETNPRAKKRRAQKLAQAWRRLGYAVTLTPISPDVPMTGQA